MAGKFTGWKGDFKGFFLGLRVSNNKAYFEAHRRQYEDDVKAPMLALLADLEAEFGPTRRVSRPNRDIRFSADKSPYKLNLYADVERGGYVALDAEGLVAAGGRYMVDDVQLKRLREAIAADRSGQALESIVAGLRKLVSSYDAEFQKRMLQNVVLAGGGSQLRGLDRLIEDDLQQYGGQQVVNGDMARAYANGFIGRHLDKVAGGLTYSQVSSKAQANPTDTKLAAQVQTLFRGETLRGLLLNAYGWWTIGTYALYAAIGLALAAFAVLGALAFEIFLAIREPRKVKASIPTTKPQRAIA